MGKPLRKARKRLAARIEDYERKMDDRRVESYLQKSFNRPGSMRPRSK